MNLRSKFVAIAGSALILASSITMGVAADPAPVTGDAIVSIDAADDAGITVSITESTDFGDHAYSLTDRPVTGEMTVTVDDSRGTAVGWTVNLKATDFVPQEGSSVNAVAIPVGKLALIPAENYPAVKNPAAQPAANTRGQVASSLSPVSSSDSTLWTATNTNGAGTFDLKLNGTLTIPGGTLVGDYTSVVTVSLENGPS